MQCAKTVHVTRIFDVLDRVEIRAHNKDWSTVIVRGYAVYHDRIGLNANEIMQFIAIAFFSIQTPNRPIKRCPRFHPSGINVCVFNKINRGSVTFKI